MLSLDLPQVDAPLRFESCIAFAQPFVRVGQIRRRVDLLRFKAVVVRHPLDDHGVHTGFSEAIQAGMPMAVRSGPSGFSRDEADPKARLRVGLGKFGNRVGLSFVLPNQVHERPRMGALHS